MSDPLPVSATDVETIARLARIAPATVEMIMRITMVAMRGAHVPPERESSAPEEEATDAR